MSLSAENQRRMERAAARARALVAADARLGQSLPSRADFERVVAGRTSIEIVEAAALTYAERPALGRRRVVRGEALPELETFTYAEIWQRVQRLASGMRASGVAEGDLVLLIGFTTVDHFVAELACHYLAAVSVPLAKSIGEEELRAIAAQCEATTVCCSADVLAELAARIGAAPRAFAALARAIVLDAGEADQRVAVRGVEVMTCTACEERGRRAGLFPPVVPGGSAVSPGGDDRLLSLVYTSGSTGEPKGAMFGERAWRARWATLPFEELLELPMVSLVFLPQNHMGGRNALANSWKLGGLAYLTHASDLSTLFEDLKLVRPTYLHLVPRLSEQLYQHYQRELARAEPASASAPEAILAELREQMLGGRLLLALTASAPTPPEVLAFVQRAFDIPVVNVFAGTEYGQLFVDGKVNRRNVLEHLLVSAPELGYSVDDRPYPRGELWVRTARGITSYFKNEAATRALRDERGFLRTGDIFEQRGPDELVWIDRRNNVQKLAQGEFVNIGRLEALFSSGSPRFQQVYLHADSRRAYLAAVVVPADPAAAEDELRAELARVGAAHQLAAYEVPRLVLVEPAPFTRENGLLTSLGKLARPKLKQRYAAALEERYRAAEARQAEPLSDEAPGTGEAAPARLAEAVAAVLGLPVAQLELARSFRELGGDSLAAHALRARLAAAGVSLSLGKLLRSSLAELMGELAGGAPAPAALPSFAAIHGAQAVALAAAELRLARFGAPLPLLTGAAPPRDVLLTGATGYLGRFLCLALLERAAEHGGRVICLVRGGDDRQAQARLAACYGAASAPLAQRFAALAEHLVVVAGELEAPRLGLSEERYRQLADAVGRVVHAAALVNHALPYAQLFDANVAGSAEVFRFCASRRIKRCAFVSTHSLSLALLGERALAGEDDDLRRLGDGWRLDDTAAPHGDGYRASKWAGEVLAADLATSYGAPVDIFRCSLILPPARARGQLHHDDFFIRLVTSAVQTGLVPASFYAAAAARPHLDGLPVDFLAEALAAIVGEPPPPPPPSPTGGPTVYHAINPHDDGISLDTVMRRLELRGYPISRIEDHATWFARFTAALAALPAAARAASSLPIAAQWRQPLDADRRRRVSAERFHAQVRALRPGGALDIPRLDAELIDLYLDDLVAVGLLPSPLSASR